jgi:hypothetical protein
VKPIYICLALVLTACVMKGDPSTEPVEPTPAPKPQPGPEPIPPPSHEVPPYATGMTCGNRTWNPLWNDVIGEALDEFGQRLIAAEISLLCPGYMTSSVPQKKAFWTLFVASVACPESGYNPDSHHDEPPPLGYPSRGLLQLSYEDWPGHPRCELRREKANAYDPKTNLRCGVAILDDEMGRLGTIFHNKSYWAVLRPNRKAHLTKAHYAKYKDKLTFCW